MDSSSKRLTHLDSEGRPRMVDVSDKDESHREQKAVQDLTDDYCGKVDDAAQKKEQEIMTV